MVSPLAFFDQPGIRLLVLTPDYRDFLWLISLAHSLDMSVAAEGVETYAQMEFLRQLNCDHVQGYYFSRPMPWGHLVQFLRNQRQSACL